MSDFQRFAHLVWCHPCGVQIMALHPYLGFRCAAPQAKGFHPCGVLRAHVFIHTGLACALSQAEGFHPCGVLAASVASKKEGWVLRIAHRSKSGVIPAYHNSVVLPISEGGKDSCDHSDDYSCHESFPPDWKGDKAKTGKGGNDSCPGWVGCAQQQRSDYNIYEVKEM